MKEQQYREIKHILENCKNPLFFFDGDSDGLSSFLLLRRFRGKGNWCCVRDSSLGENYLEHVKKNNPDIVFILDVPVVAEEFFSSINRKVIWIDHHEPVNVPDFVQYFNPRLHDKDIYLPTSYLCYRIVLNDLWIAMTGMVGDYFLPEFKDDFRREFPDLLNEEEPGKALFNDKIGNLSRIFSFILKGENSELKKCVNALIAVESPYDILDKKTSNGRLIHKRFEKINDEYEKLKKQALSHIVHGKIGLFKYESWHEEIGFSADLSTELSFLFPDRVIMIAREKEDYVSVSMRSKTIKLPDIVRKSLEGIHGIGGGHEYACGAHIRKEDFDLFLDNFKKAMS